MSIKGYYLESINPRFYIYRIIIISYLSEVYTYTITVDPFESIHRYCPDFVNLGGILDECIG